MLVDVGCRVGAEVGVLFGDFSKRLCEAGLFVFAVDPWKAFPHHLERNPDYQRKRDAVYKKAVRTLAPYENHEIIRLTSMEALGKFLDGSLDFVYLDAGHGFRDIAADLYEWSRKVRPGGIVAGHDYHMTPKCHVQYVVDAYVKTFGIDRWFVLDKDESPSWFWVKQ